jgi:hypothetical protein
MKHNPLVLLVALSVLVFGVGSVSGEETLLRDDFDDPEISKAWSNPAGTGTVTFRDGFAFLNTTDKSKAEQATAHRAALSTQGLRYRYTSLETRLRCSDDNRLESDVGGGLRFWGFIDFTGDKFLYFVSASPESGELGGFHACSGVSGMKLWEPMTAIDMREWHTYTILWEPGNATFLVDEQVVATTDQVPKYGMDFWIGNNNYEARGGLGQGQLGRIDVPFNQSIQVDHVHLFRVPERTLLSTLGMLLLPALLPSSRGKQRIAGPTGW